jgi:HEAT repeat protein
MSNPAKEPSQISIQAQIATLQDKLVELKDQLLAAKRSLEQDQQRSISLTGSGIPSFEQIVQQLEQSYTQTENQLVRLYQQQGWPPDLVSSPDNQPQQLSWGLESPPEKEEAIIRAAIRASLEARQTQQTKALQAKLDEAFHLLGEGEAFRLLVKATQTDDRNFERESIIIQLRQLADQRVVEALLGWLGLQDSLGFWAALAVGRLADKETILPRLLEKLKDSDHMVRVQTISALGHLAEVALNPNTAQPYQVSASISNFEPKDDRIIEALIAMLADQHPKVRARAVSTLCHLGDQRATPSLLAALEDPAREVRISAAAFLGSLGDQRAIEPLVKAMESGDEDIRSRAMQSLDFLGYEGVAAPLAVQFFQAFGNLSRNQAEAEELAQQYLEKTQAGDEAGVSALFSQLFNRNLAPEGVEPLLAQLKDPLSQVRSDAADRLGFLKEQRAVEPMIDLLNDRDQVVKASAISALGLIGDRRAVEPLLGQLEDPDAHYRMLAVNALGQIADPDTFEAILARLEDKAGEVRQMAVSALGQLRDPRAFEALLKQVEASNQARQRQEEKEQFGIGYSAIIALGQLGDPRAYDHLMSWLKAEDPETRIAAAQGLGELGDNRALPALEWARDHDPYHNQDGHEYCVHQAAAKAIQLIQTKS